MCLSSLFCVLQADVHEISGDAYIVFGIILFFWELLPTSLVVVFFRVQRPNHNLVRGFMTDKYAEVVYAQTYMHMQIMGANSTTLERIAVQRAEERC